MKKVLLILAVLTFLCSAAPKPKKSHNHYVKPTVPEYMYVQVDLNDYLGFIDRNTDWNYTESDNYTDSILKANKIFCRKGVWVKKIKIKDFFSGKETIK